MPILSDNKAYGSSGRLWLGPLLEPQTFVDDPARRYRAMFHKQLNYAAKRLMAIPPINIFGNFLSAFITFVWFAIVLPGRDLGGSHPSGLTERMLFFFILMAVFVVAVGRINFRWWHPLFLALNGIGPLDGSRSTTSEERKHLHMLAGKIMDLPIKLALTSFIGWIACGLTLCILPHIIPTITPWHPHTARKICVWMIVFGAPMTVIIIYFIQERWLRVTMLNFFPEEVLTSIPPSYRMNVLPKMLVVSLLIGTLPVSLISHITLRQITLIKAGRQSIETFVSHMPVMIAFLLSISIIVAVVLSLHVTWSVSQPLRTARSAMRRLGRGDLGSNVPVVSNDEIGVMGEGFNRMVEGLRDRDLIRDTFGRYVSEEVAAEILKSSGGIALEGEVREITVLVSDLRGFTPMTASLKPQAVLRIINRYLERMTDIILHHGGTIDEFTGDGILVFFGAPRS
ncbi:adenylate/guanylate cyclase domain-containing protein, partial [Thermodesulfobacteriota bacterium]